ncbi:hypothetical protein [Wohlfahrtiimonas larvae]|nr:hypothetical protein [Wohlfahrtiimonas larvae]
MMDKILKFKYKNVKGEEHYFEIYLIKSFEYYFTGRTLDTDEYKTFKKERVIEYGDDSKSILDQCPIDASKVADNSFGFIKSYNPDLLFEVCFTGFKKADKTRLTEIAQNNNMYIASDTTANLGALVCGYNAGPKKIERALNNARTVEIMDEDEFLHFIETGEVKSHKE